jgi:hypothetical protein
MSNSEEKEEKKKRLEILKAIPPLDDDEFPDVKDPISRRLIALHRHQKKTSAPASVPVSVPAFIVQPTIINALNTAFAAWQEEMNQRETQLRNMGVWE